MGLFLNTDGQYSASTYEIARNLLRSRDTQRECAQKLEQERDKQIQANERLRREYASFELQLRLAEQQRDQAQQELQRMREQPLQLPNDPSLPYHSYGPRMISVCIQLAKKVGIRASTEAPKIVLDWLSISVKIPDWTSVRTWLCRMGVDALKHARERHDDWICFADHSNPIGKEKVLSILGVRACHLPPPGQTLGRQHVRVLSVVPGTQWKCEDVAKQYRALAEEIGTPKMLLTDGAVELRESAQAMEKDGKKPILLRDLKHFAANALERMIGSTEAFTEILESAFGMCKSLEGQHRKGGFTSLLASFGALLQDCSAVRCVQVLAARR